MPRAARKRKLNEKSERKVTSKKKCKLSKNVADESEKENLAEINNDIEIIRLTEDLLENDEEIDEDDGDWEDVSDLDDRSDIVVNLNGESFDSSSEKTDEKREQQKQARERRELIHKTHLLALIGRIIFINRLINEELIQNMSLSCLSDWNVADQKWKEPNLRRLVISITDKFVLENDESEFGNISEIIQSAFHTHRVSKAWINVLLVSIVRSIGIRARLVSFVYPSSLRVDTKSAPEAQHGILNPPTSHKPSTRGGSKKYKPFSSKSIISPENRRTSSIEFSLELLDGYSHVWLPFDARVSDSWGDMSLVLGERRRFVYCVAIDNGGRIKNLAAKYDRSWTSSVSRRQRVADAVFTSMIGSAATPEDSSEERLEDAAVRDRLIKQGIPASLADLKGNPVFVARSHLLKYEVLHPRDEATPFGRWRLEDVFLRDQVHLAHTRETWLKEAKVVRNGELPCKKVKTMSSRRRNVERGADPFVELFGPWQVETYQAPVATDGRVPRNRFDNVDLFQPSMLPVGCSHLRLPELNKIAATLDIDCAPAMVGWAFTKRNKARPIHDGWVVCSEYVDVLCAAALECRRDKQARLAAQREKLVIKRWEILTRRLLLKERLRLQYNF